MSPFKVFSSSKYIPIQRLFSLVYIFLDEDIYLLYSRLENSLPYQILPFLTTVFPPPEYFLFLNSFSLTSISGIFFTEIILFQLSPLFVFDRLVLLLFCL